MSESDYLSQSCIPPFLSRNRPVLCCDDNPYLSDYSDEFFMSDCDSILSDSDTVVFDID